MTLESKRINLRSTCWRARLWFSLAAALCSVPTWAQVDGKLQDQVQTDVQPAVRSSGADGHSLVREAVFPPQQIARLDLDEAALVDALLDVLPSLSRYARPAEPPRLVYLPTAKIRAQACSVPCPVLAYYAGGRDIFLDQSLNPLVSLFDRSILLHEMVHYLQAQQEDETNAMDGATGRARCRLWYAREYEAYAVQQSFLILVHSRANAGKVPGRSNC